MDNHKTPFIWLKMNYEHWVKKVKHACGLIERIGSNVVNHTDGRIVSAMNEQGILTLLENKLLEINPETIIYIPKHRHWYDIMIDGIPINLKLTTGGTDNAFNKNALLFSLTGKIDDKNCGSFDKLLKRIQTYKLKTSRDKLTEYHYLVIHKETGRFLLKSMFDISVYASNPCNILQINWKNEFANLFYETEPEDYVDKVKELIKTIQTSILMDMESKREFANMECSTLFENGVQ